MEVILEKDYPQLGFVGDRVQIKRGYGRNYLIPQGIAVEINARNERFLKNKLALIATNKAKRKSDALEMATKLQAETFTFQVKVGSKGKAFGSLGAKEIFAELISRGYQLDRNQVTSESVRQAGDYTFQVKLHSELTAKVPYKVIAEKVNNQEHSEVEEELDQPKASE